MRAPTTALAGPPGTRRARVGALLAILLAVLALAAVVGLSLMKPSPRNGAVLVNVDCGLSLVSTLDGETRVLVPGIAGCEGSNGPPFYLTSASADGRTLAYSLGCVPCDGARESALERLGLWVVDVPTGEQHRLVKCGPQQDSLDSMVCSIDVAVSPDGTEVAYVHWDHRSDTAPLVVVKADGSGARSIDLPARPTGFAWAPDGATLVVATTSFAPSGYGAGHLYRVSTAGGSPALILDMQGLELSSPAWSPDGRQISVDAWRNEDQETSILVVDQHGTLRQLVSSGSPGVPVRGVGWSRDATRIGYLRTPTTQAGAELHVLDVRTGDDSVAFPKAGTTCCSSIGPAAWSPDGQWLALGIQDPDGEAGLYLIRPDGSGMRRVSSSLSVMEWLPE